MNHSLFVFYTILDGATKFVIEQYKHVALNDEVANKKTYLKGVFVRCYLLTNHLIHFKNRQQD